MQHKIMFILTFVLKYYSFHRSFPQVLFFPKFEIFSPAQPNRGGFYVKAEIVGLHKEALIRMILKPVVL